jgi:RNA polymerase sigma-70 factor (ECF subfamily)
MKLPDPDASAGNVPAETRRLVRAAREGDISSFARLYDRIAPAVHTWADLRLRPSLRARCEPADIVQEVWCRAWRSLDKLDPDTPFRPWIFRIAKNVLLEALRHAQGAAEGQGSPGPTTRLFALENLPDDATAISLRVARDGELQAFATLVRSLDEEDRALVLHCGLEGLGYREVATRLEISVEAVAKRWQRLRARLLERGLPRVVFLDETS